MEKKIWLLLSVVLCCALASMLRAYAEEEFKFWASEDAWVNEANPMANYGNNTYLSVKDRSGLAESYIKFSNNDLGVLCGKTIASVSLFLYQYQYNYSPADTINLHKVIADWDEGLITWNSKPAFAALNSSSLNLENGNSLWREWPALENMVASWLNGPNYGLVLENNKDAKTEELFARFYSSEYSNADYHPYLRVIAAATPEAITTTPEPTSAALLLLGLSALAVKAYRRRKS